MIKLIKAIEGLRTLRESAYIPEVPEGLMEGEGDWDMDRHPYEFLEDTIDILEDTVGTLLQLYNAVQLEEIRKASQPKPKPKAKGKVGRPKKELHKSEAQRVAEIREEQRRAAARDMHYDEMREEVTDRLGQETEDDIFKQAEELFGAS